MTNNADESIMLYIPEYDNINAATDRKATISLQLMRDGEEEGNYTLHFCNYTAEGFPTQPQPTTSSATTTTNTP